jgi:hypothetical protein
VGINQKSYFHQKLGVSITECSHPTGIKKWCKLARALKQKVIKQMSIKKGLGVLD